jgi:hypothetical protein
MAGLAPSCISAIYLTRLILTSLMSTVILELCSCLEKTAIAGELRHNGGGIIVLVT